MSNTVKIRSRSALPGTGFDSAGSPKQGKRRVLGTISVTSYTAVGETFNPQSAGLSAFDYVAIRHNDQAADKEGRGTRLVNFCNSTNDFYILQWTGSNFVLPTGTSHTLQFHAEGDAQDGVELF